MLLGFKKIKGFGEGLCQSSISQCLTILTKIFGFPIPLHRTSGGSDGKETACNAGDGFDP